MKSEYDRLGLRGPVHSCLIQRTLYLRRCAPENCAPEERRDSMFFTFRENGALARREYRNPDGSGSTAVYEYDPADRLAVSHLEGAAGEVRSTFYEYDPEGRLVRVVARPPDTQDRVIETYEYDASGRRTKFVPLDPQSRANVAFKIEGSDTAYPASGAVTVRTDYNQQEQPAVTTFLDASGREVNRVELRFDDRGNLIEETQICATDAWLGDATAGMNTTQLEALRGLFAFHCTHRYDPNGRRIETSSSMGPLGEDRMTVEYNEHGDPIREISSHIERDYELTDEGKLGDAPNREHSTSSETRIGYFYDDRGNWLTKTVESRGGPDKDFTVGSIERRTLTYFN